jgi:hypothetical protein
MNYIKTDDNTNKILLDKAKNDLLYFKKCNIITNTNIFINISNTSNGISNFINDINNFINDNIKIYVCHKNSIDEFISIKNTEDNIIKIINILGHIKLSYYSGYKDNIIEYIKDNNINNYYIYY